MWAVPVLRCGVWPPACEPGGRPGWAPRTCHRSLSDPGCGLDRLVEITVGRDLRFNHPSSQKENPSLHCFVFAYRSSRAQIQSRQFGRIIGDSADRALSENYQSTVKKRL